MRQLIHNIQNRAVEARQLAHEAGLVARAGTAHVGPRERVVDVAAHAPGVGHGLGPVPGAVGAPVAESYMRRSEGWLGWGIERGTCSRGLVGLAWRS